jgi:DNA-binding NarL/FixJ family response regulator
MLSRQTHLLIGPDGQVECMTSGRGHMVRNVVVTKTGRVVREMIASGRQAATMYMGSTKVHISRLEGNATHFLASIEKVPVVRPALRELPLSSAQRVVAEHAAHGATTGEIARHLGRSVDTVKAHLREVYKRLDVGSRLELADVLRGAGYLASQP